MIMIFYFNYQFLKEAIYLFLLNFHFHLRVYDYYFEFVTDELIKHDSYFHNKAIFLFHAVNYQ